MSLENTSPLQIVEFLGLNTKQSRAKLYPGFSPDTDTFHDIDLSTPGVAKVRGGFDAINASPLAYTPTRIHDGFRPSNGEHKLFISGGTVVTVMDHDGTNSNIGTGFTDGEVFDYLNFLNYVFYSNGVDEPKCYDWTSQRKWGITAPAAANTFAADSGTGLTGDYYYRFTYYNSTSGHESSASPLSAKHTVANKTINLSGLTASADSQVDKIRIYRTTNGGAICWYLAEISNGTTTYADSIADTALGTTEAPLDNDPPPLFAGIEDWDGRIWGFEKNSTRVKFSNDEYLTPAGTGNPYESFSQDNYIEFNALVYGIAKSPNFDELWVHTSKGIFACVRTEVPEDPYRPLIRNSNFWAVNHFSIVNIYNEQWFVAEEFKVLSLDSAGNLSYESYLIEPTLQQANLARLYQVQAVQYKSNSKNQYRLIYIETGKTSPNLMLAANYLLRTPPDEHGKSYSVWEYHKMNMTALGVVIDESLGQAFLYTADANGYIYKQDTGTNDNGSAIDWSMSLGWVKSAGNPGDSSVMRRVLQYFRPLGDWSISLRTDFDFGDSGGQVYPVSFPPVGDQFDVDFTFDVSVFAADNPLRRTPSDLTGVYSYVRLAWYGNTLDQTMEMHSVVFMPVHVEGFRGKN